MTGQAIENDALTSVELPDDPKMTDGHRMTIKDGVLNFEKPWWVEEQEKEDKNKADFINDIDALQKAKNLADVLPLIEKMIKKTYNQE